MMPFPGGKRFTTIPGLVLDINADVGVSQSGGFITGVADQSSMGNNVVPFVNGGHQAPILTPNALNGRDAIVFSGGASLGNTGSTTISCLGPLHLFAVVKAVSPQQKIHLVGHDWGALYGWDALYDARASQHIASFVTMAPSLNQVGLWMRQRLLHPTPRKLGQLLHQSLISNGLMSFFAMPLVPGLLWRSGLAVRLFGYFMKRFEGLTYVPNEGVENDAIRYLGIYRANLLQQVLRPQGVTQTAIPVHALIASRDPFLPPRVFEGCRDWATQYSESTVDAAHWAPLSQARSLATTIGQMARRYAVA